jgi:CubicO group peptidase (beta-lactamase class C family)
VLGEPHTPAGDRHDQTEVDASPRRRDLPKVATGFVADVICSETFVSGLDPEKDFAETTAAMPGVGLISWALDYRVDRVRKDVTVSLLGVGRRRAVYRGEFGCFLDHGDAVAPIAPLPVDRAQASLLPEIAGSSIVAPQSEALAAALDRAFAEPEQPPFRRTRAIVVVRDGRIIAERYAAGIGIDTPLLGFSATKSVIAALTGILVRQGKLRLDQGSPVAAWQKPDDPRHSITVDQLLRHTAGLALGSSLQASLGAALEPVNRMKFMESDMAAFAASAPLETPPGRIWNYHDGNYLILSKLILDAAGGTPTEFLRLARQELFAPLGMRHVTIEFDGAGTPEGSSQMLASARDWARFGLLFSQRWRGWWKTHPARGLCEIFGLTDADRVRRLWRGILDQSRRQFWRPLSNRTRLAARCVLRQGIDRPICDRDSLAAPRARPPRPHRELAT